MSLTVDEIVIDAPITLGGGTGGLPPILSTANPAPADSGYTVGILWVNQTLGKIFYLIDNTSGAAVWEEVIIESQRDVALGFAGLDASGDLVANIIHRTGTTAELAVIVLAEGEIAYATDTGYLWKGDGATAGGIVQPQTLLQLGILDAQASITIGDSATVGGAESAIALGEIATATSDGSIAIGPTTSATNVSATAVGSSSTASGVTSVALGSTASATATGAFQLGFGTNATTNTIQFRDSGGITADEFGYLSGVTSSIQTQLDAAGGGAFTADGDSLVALTAPITLDAAVGNEVALTLDYTTNKATSGDDTGLVINQTATLTQGTSLLIDAQSGGTSAFSVQEVTGAYGRITLGSGSTARGDIYAGAQQIFKMYASGWGAQPIEVHASGGLSLLGTSKVLTFSTDLILRRAAAATLQLGTDADTVTTDQTLKAHDVTTGTGASLTLAGGSGSVAQGDVNIEGDDVLITAGASTIQVASGQINLGNKIVATNSAWGIGKSTARWGTAYLGTSLDIKSAAGSNALIKLDTGEAFVTATQVLGKISFGAPDEASGTDAILDGAAIWAVASDTFAADNNSTDLVFATGASEVAAEKMRIDSSGNVGIGTTTPGAIIHSKGAHASGIAIQADSVTANHYSVIKFVVSTNDAATAVATIRGVRDTSSTGHLDFFSGTTKTVRFSSSGNVGIGTTEPLAPLDVTTEAIVSAPALVALGDTANYERLSLSVADGGVASIQVAGGGTGGVADQLDLVNSAGVSGISFLIDSTPRLLFTGATQIRSTGTVGLFSSGKLSIGAESNMTSGDAVSINSTGGALLDTNGEQSWVEVAPTVNQSGTAAYNALKIDVTETALGDGTTGDGNNLINAAVGGTSKFVIQNTGNVGIGTASPTAQLHVDQSSATGAQPALKLDQADIDDSFIDFIGTSAADGTRSISSDTTEDSAKFGAIRVEINGVTKWIRIYDDES